MDSEIKMLIPKTLLANTIANSFLICKGVREETTIFFNYENTLLVTSKLKLTLCSSHLPCELRSFYFLVFKMLVKFLSWPRKTQAKNPNSPFSYISRFLNHSLSQDPYDPPFSFTPKPTKPKPKQAKQKPPEPNTKDPKLPLKSGLPFDFRYSYSESNPAVEPIGYREPKRFSPFGPGRLDRKWTGTAAPAPPPSQMDVDPERLKEERNRILGYPLTEEEVAELVERYRHSDCSRQINLGNFHF